MSIKQRSKSLSSLHADLSDTMFQLKVLNGSALVHQHFEPFSDKVGFDILPTLPQVLQVNVGKLCNQSCAHCHVDAGPDRKAENMDKATMIQCLEILHQHQIQTVDITGGAPEMNPNFRWFVEQCRSMGKTVLNRCNLTIVVSNPKYHDLPEFFASNQVQLISSLPYFSKLRTDSQRGEGVFHDSIEALKMLNKVGYGIEGAGLTIDLVYNPTGAFLPGDQKALEHEFKLQLQRRYDVHFNRLFAITNLPISRFLDYLISTQNYVPYMEALIAAFNPATIDGLMCRNTISVSWDGYLYDCDFNQMLDLKAAANCQHISKFNIDEWMNRKIVVNQHCYGCTAGAGSSCGGEIV